MTSLWKVWLNVALILHPQASSADCSYRAGKWDLQAANRQENEAVTEISSTFEELEKALHQRKTALITDLENICSTKQKVKRLHLHFTFSHLADAFIQSDLQLGST